MLEWPAFIINKKIEKSYLLFKNEDKNNDNSEKNSYKKKNSIDKNKGKSLNINKNKYE